MSKRLFETIIGTVIAAAIIGAVSFALYANGAIARNETRISNNEKAIIEISKIRDDVNAIRITVTRIAERLNVPVEKKK